MSKCKHKWVNMEDGTNDKFCVRCRKFAMQAVATINAEQGLNLGSKIAEGLAGGLESSIHVEVNMNHPTSVDSLVREIERNIERGIRSKGVI